MSFSRPPGDAGEADPAVTAALDAFARGAGSEHDALLAIAGSRLLVPVVAVLSGGSGGTDRPPSRGGHREGRPPGDNTDMALPTLIGNDGRKAVIAFTGTETLMRWRADARPVPVAAPRACQAALAEGDALVIDVAGPVPLVLEGARLRALAAGQPPPPPHEDPDVRSAVAAVTPHFTLKPGEPGTDLLVTLESADPAQARQAAEQVALALSTRLRRVSVALAQPKPRQQPLLSRTDRSARLSVASFSMVPAPALNEACAWRRPRWAGVAGGKAGSGAGTVG